MKGKWFSNYTNLYCSGNFAMSKLAKISNLQWLMSSARSRSVIVVLSHIYVIDHIIFLKHFFLWCKLTAIHGAIKLTIFDVCHLHYTHLTTDVVHTADKQYNAVALLLLLKCIFNHDKRWRLFIVASFITVEYWHKISLLRVTIFFRQFENILWGFSM